MHYISSRMEIILEPISITEVTVSSYRWIIKQRRVQAYSYFQRHYMSHQNLITFLSDCGKIYRQSLLLSWVINSGVYTVVPCGGSFIIHTCEDRCSAYLAQVRRRRTRLSSKVDMERSTPVTSFTLSRLYLTFSYTHTYQTPVELRTLTLFLQPLRKNSKQMSISKTKRDVMCWLHL